MQIPTVGENQEQMRTLALSIMNTHLRMADKTAAKYEKWGDLKLRKLANDYLAISEQWRVRARQHGASV